VVSDPARQPRDASPHFAVGDPAERRDKPVPSSDSMKSMMSCGMPLWRGDDPGAPSNRNDTGISSTAQIRCSRLAPIRFVPVSYFWICWSVSPIASPLAPPR
jgi:hypothetical protein